MKWRLIWQDIHGKARKSGYSPTKRFDKVDRRHIKASFGLVEFARAISLQVLEGQRYSFALAPHIRANSIQPFSTKLVSPDPSCQLALIFGLLGDKRIKRRQCLLPYRVTLHKDFVPSIRDDRVSRYTRVHAQMLNGGG